MRKRIEINILIPLALLAAIFIFFVCASKGQMVSAYNLKSLFDQVFVTIIAALGSLFVVACGGTDLSVGTTVGLSTVFSTMLVSVFGWPEWTVFPVIIAVGLLQGFLNGFLTTKLKVPSFMVTLAMLIGVRGLVKYIQDASGLYFAGKTITVFNQFYLKLPILIIIIAVSYYLLEYTRFGEYCKSIGENASVARSIGVPVEKIRTGAFVISSLFAAISGIFVMAKTGGTTNTMGTNMEIEVVMGIFLGGVLVTGGYSTKVEKAIIGSVTISLIKNGMILIGLTTTQVTEFTRGVLLMLILFITLKFGDREILIGKSRDAVELNGHDG